jgi:hypothetical protein
MCVPAEDRPADHRIRDRRARHRWPVLGRTANGGVTNQDISLAKWGQVRQCVGQRGRSCITICCVKTLTIRTDAEVEQALESLTRNGQSRSEATRAAILAAERTHRRELLRAEAEQLRNDPDDVSASRELAAEMDAIRAW